MSDKKISIIGLPNSGKTTFLAAFWSYIQSDEKECELKLDGYTKQYPHLNELQHKWEMAETVNRTAAQSKQEAIINLINVKNGKKFNLIIPDLSGEEFETQISTRKVSKYYLDICNEALGFLVFVSANKLNDDITHHDLGESIGGLAKNDKINSWEHKSIPYQVRLIEVLQFILNPPFENKKLKISLIISAWDTATHNTENPEEWIRKEFPMLHQFLNSNKRNFDTIFFGISAQGGDISIPETRDTLLSNFKSSERIVCQNSTGKTNNITLPILWIMSNENN